MYVCALLLSNCLPVTKSKQDSCFVVSYCLLKAAPPLQTMKEVAEERLAHLRDMYSPGWMDSENSDVDFNRLSSVQLVSSQQSRTREYLRKVEATRSDPYHARAHHSAVAGGGGGGFGSYQSRSSVGGVAGGGRGLREPATTSRQLQASSDSVDIDLPMFTETEDVV